MIYPKRECAFGARGCSIILTEDNQNEENLTKLVTARKVKCEKINYEDEMEKDKPRRMLTRPGRLRAQSGSKLPPANVPLRVLEGGCGVKVRVPENNKI